MAEVLDGIETRKRQGPIAALALLVGIILGSAPVAGDLNGRTPRLAPTELAKAAPAIRSAPRGSADEGAEPVFLAAAPPAPRHARISLHDAATAAGSAAPFAPAAGPLAYRARAPPAA